jgi:hypothetical protein
MRGNPKEECHEDAHEQFRNRTEEYGEEIMSAGWNPAVEKVCELLLGSPTDATLSTPGTNGVMKCLR